MSYKLGLAALNMEMTDTVPRTEYSAESHWELIKKVTGIDTAIKDSRQEASESFCKAWEYSFNWCTCIHGAQISAKGPTTDLGHAIYMENKEGQSDYSDHTSVAYPDPMEALELDIPTVYGEYGKDEIISMFDEKFRLKCKNVPDALNMAGIYINPVSGMLKIFGWDTLLMMMGLDLNKFNKVLESYCIWLEQFYRGFCESNVPVFMMHDDICWTSGPFAPPEWYRTQIFPWYTKWINMLKASGKRVIFTSDGDYSCFFDDIVKCGAEMLVMEPCCDMAIFAEKYGETHGFVGGVDVRILQGSKEEIRKAVQTAMDIGKKCPGYIFCTGNHIPPNVPVNNAIYYNDCYLKMRKR
ncbi:MAG: uroporphyrinogen decarboxylase family protein [Victivallaceae bacterium]|nr:uroporphyrinogen decarboxylase family protein [Victivallaceae bacterium]